ncbi:MAG: nucleoside deaminase [Candidatus Krumholzibacteriota bacterium]
MTGDKVAFIDRLLAVIETEIVPLTVQGVQEGNKVFGGAVLRKADLSTVVAVTNAETGNPLHHGEISTLNAFYELPRAGRPATKDCLFISTHEPCSLCLSAITWTGFDNFFYLFSYEDTRDAFNIPHDLKILDEVFGCPDGSYARKNDYWCSWGIQELVARTGEEDRAGFAARIAALRKTYDELSEVYQASRGRGADIPLD